jgi:lipoprotein-anchoring transpeptidase ErfK/SrfK
MDSKIRRFGAIVLFGVLLVVMTACSASPLSGQAGKTASSAPIVRNDTPPPSPSPEPTPKPSPTPEPTSRLTQPQGKPGVQPAPVSTGKAIVVSLSQQWLYAYMDGELVFDYAVETGRPELPTPAGTFSVLEKVQDVMFTSPWPQGSPYYYEPTHVNYGLLFKEGGFFLHDATWHVQFGPGSNVPHQLADGSWETGSHGCVGMRLQDAERLYAWAPVGTPVVISN